MRKEILFINCSPKKIGSRSSTFAQEFVDNLELTFPRSNLVHRDLSNFPITHVTSEHTFASEKQANMLNAMDKVALELSDTLIEELETSDILVIATPMHNYTVPSVLKAWIDHVVRAHRTIKLTPQGKVGLIGDKRTYIIVSSGGRHSQQPAWQPDFLTPYLTEILRTIGIISVEFIFLEAMNYDPATVELALNHAYSRSRELLIELKEQAFT
jgi:FMN-dependent NADH-azoreductase